MPRFFPAASAFAGLLLLLHVPTIGQEGGAGAPEATDSAPVDGQGSTVIQAVDAQIRLDKEATLASDRPGILKFVEPEEGDRVTAGSQVAGLKDEVAVAALAVAEKTAENDVEIRYSQAAAAVAEAEYQRSLEGNERGRQIQLSADLIVAVELERLRLAVERARLQIQNAQLEQEVAELTAEEKAAELETYQIVTPIDGVVTEVLKHSGEAVQQGDPILRVVRTDVVRVEGFISVAEAFRVRPGDAVTVRLDATKIDGLPPQLARRAFEGRIVFVDPTAQLVANMVRVWATVPNDDNLLRAGLPATMEIVPSGDMPDAFEPESEP